MSDDQIQVSVICMTYNHEKYIRQCLDGFVMQKTSFKFEVIVHDDASTDKTPEIVREYEERYPELIRPIYQRVNQYSQKVDTIATWIFPAIRGRYVALCEGDDYWIDNRKLQKQFDVMEQNLECRFCVHKVSVVGLTKFNNKNCIPSIPVKNGMMNSEVFFKYFSREYIFHTSSYFFRVDDFKMYLSAHLEFKREFEKIGVGDQVMLLYWGQLGNVYYFDQIMSCYRFLSDGSWTSKRRNLGLKYCLDSSCVEKRAFELFDQFTIGRYHKEIQRKIDSLNFIIDFSKAVLSEDSRELKELYGMVIRGCYKDIPLKRKIRIFLCAYCPPIYRIVRGIRDRFISG